MSDHRSFNDFNCFTGVAGKVSAWNSKGLSE